MDDLAAADRQVATRVDAGIRSGDLEDAVRALDALESAVAGVSVDHAFVRRKLERVNQRIRQAGRDEDSAVKELAGAALQDFLEGRLEATNRRLNQILTLVRAP
jgi:hypothetical protein